MADVPKVAFLYSRSAGYRVVPATGVYGGPTPTGQIVVQFFVDQVTEPTKVVHAVTAEGKLGEEVERDPPGKTITREFQIGVALTPEIADSIGKWLQEKAAAARQRKERGGPKGKSTSDNA